MSNTILAQAAANVKRKKAEIGQILTDKNEYGKERPWEVNKLRSLRLANAYDRLSGGEGLYGSVKAAERKILASAKVAGITDKPTSMAVDERAYVHDRQYIDSSKHIKTAKGTPNFQSLSERVLNCGSHLLFKAWYEGDMAGMRKLHYASFCKSRLCAMCNWRRSLRLYSDLSAVMDEVERRQSGLVPLFLTLTVKNVKGEKLRDTVDILLKGWGKLMKYDAPSNAVVGYYRTLECTYKLNKDDFHPHIHALLLVEEKYFKSKQYISERGWIKMWRVACGLDYDPVCDIRRLKPSAVRSELVEVTKQQIAHSKAEKLSNDLLEVPETKLNAEQYAGLYFAKPADLPLPKSKKHTDRIVQVLTEALHGKRMVCFGGLMKIIAKDLKLKGEDGDLTVTDNGGTTNPTVEAYIEHYCFGYGGHKEYRLRYVEREEERNARLAAKKQDSS
jgi:plasmid rolling circle replication initiator protein Rep